MKYILISILFSLGIQGCKLFQSDKTPKEEPSMNLVISNLYYQELIPGQQNEKTKYNLYFSAVAEGEFIVDSIGYDGVFSPVSQQDNGYICGLKKQYTSKKGKLQLYYHAGNERFVLDLNKVSIKEPLYLP